LDYAGEGEINKIPGLAEEKTEEIVTRDLKLTKCYEFPLWHPEAWEQNVDFHESIQQSKNHYIPNLFLILKQKPSSFLNLFLQKFLKWTYKIP